jgi:hypothetical protein
MHCEHPLDERRPVYEGGAVPRPGRQVCTLCGELLYAEAAPTPGAGALALHQVARNSFTAAAKASG